MVEVKFIAQPNKIIYARGHFFFKLRLLKISQALPASSNVGVGLPRSTNVQPAAGFSAGAQTQQPSSTAASRGATQRGGGFPDARRFSNDDQGPSGDAPLCKCGHQAVQRTVKKDGPNTGWLLVHAKLSPLWTECR